MNAIVKLVKTPSLHGRSALEALIQDFPELVPCTTETFRKLGDLGLFYRSRLIREGMPMLTELAARCLIAEERRSLPVEPRPLPRNKRRPRLTYTMTCGEWSAERVALSSSVEGCA